jgi:hypothetical protein
MGLLSTSQLSLASNPTDATKLSLNQRMSLASPDTKKLEKIAFDEMIGEGDKLAVWQTNHRSNGEVWEIVSFHNFRNGKLLNTRAIMKASEEQE